MWQSVVTDNGLHNNSSSSIVGLYVTVTDNGLHNNSSSSIVGLYVAVRRDR